MRRERMPQEKVQHVIDGFNEFISYMSNAGIIEAKDIKMFLEPYFVRAGYRSANSRGGIKDILIIHDAGIGDFIIMSAAIREIRRIYPNVHITLLVQRSALSLAENCPYVDNVIVFSAKSTQDENFFEFYKAAIEIVKYLLIHKIDFAFNFGQYPNSQLLAYMSGANEIVVRHLYIDYVESSKSSKLHWTFFPLFATFTASLESLDGTHYNEINLCVVEEYTKTQIVNKKLELWLSPSDRFLAEINVDRINSDKIYAISMGSNAKLARKKWAPENYAKLINMILEEESATFVILGGTSEVEEGNIVKSLVNSNRVLNFTDSFNFRQSAAILSLCDCYIGNDTGLMHAAAALDVPILSPNCFPADMEIIFLSALQRYYPYDVPSVIVLPKVALNECKNSSNSAKFFTGCTADGPHCINQITPETMLKAFKMLKRQISINAKTPLFCY